MNLKKIIKKVVFCLPAKDKEATLRLGEKCMESYRQYPSVALKLL